MGGGGVAYVELREDVHMYLYVHAERVCLSSTSLLVLH